MHTGGDDGLRDSAAALLDAIPDATAVLDPDGVIRSVNRAWSLFTIDNGGTVATTGVGVNYLEVCARAAGSGCLDARLVAEGIRAVRDGETVASDIEYACPSPAIGRWFVLRITRIGGAEPGILISHTNISRRKQAEQDLEHLASRDPLTGLANRTLFGRRLVSALAPESMRSRRVLVGLLYIDLDGFKLVNDTYGHAAGDEVLQTVAARLRTSTRPQDTVARLGGDEFAIVAPRVSPADVAGIAARVAAVLAEPHLLHGDVVTVGASVGTYLADSSDSVLTALDRADKAMYAVKRAGVRVI